MIRCVKYCFSDSSLHPYLLANLKRRGLFPLKPFQLQSLQHIQNSHNFFLNSCTGSGKTLAYLVPMINSILHKKDEEKQQQPKGGLILTLNKELVAQVYREIVELDIEKRLKILRTGTLGQKVIGESQQKGDFSQGFTPFISWNQTDILISTPQALMNQLTIYKAQQKSYIDPEFIAVDQADLVLQIDKNVRKSVDNLIKFVRDHSSKASNIKYMFAASSFPKKYRGAQAKEKLQNNFKVLKFVEGKNKHKLPDKLELFYIEIEATDEDSIVGEKMKYLKRIITDRAKQRLIIFCKEKSSIKEISKFISEEMKLKSEEYYAELNSEERSLSLSNFDKGISNIMVSSELGSRGLDFSLPVDCIIEYNLAENITHFINRVGRTARNGKHGEVITFVEKKNKEFFKHLRSLKEDGSQFDQLFSRKRSYSKLFKQKKDEKKE